MAYAIRRAGFLAASLAACAGTTALGQVIAYEGFAYAAGSALLGQNGGSGFTGPWSSAGYGSWSVSSAGMAYAQGGLSLATSGMSGMAQSGGYQRTMQLPQPLGDSPGSVWVAFVARQTAGGAAGSWLGITLPCSGSANPRLFIGKPFGQANWGTDAGLGGSVRQTTLAATSRALIVARIDFRAGADDVHVWVNPSLASPPSDASADLSLPSYGDFAGITKVLLETGSTAAPTAGELDEVRVGGVFADVAPARPGRVLGGYECTTEGQAIFGPSSNARRVEVRGLGSSGQDGVTIRTRSNRGDSVDIHPGDLALAGGEIKIKIRGWDGLIYGTHRLSGRPDGSMDMEFDGSGMPVTGLRVIALDGSGHPVINDPTPGPLGFRNIPSSVIDPGSCPGGGTPQWIHKVVVYNPPIFRNGEWILFEDTWVFGCPGGSSSPDFLRNTLTVLGLADPAAVVGGIDAMTITASGVDSIGVARPGSNLGGASVTGLGDALLDSACDDGSQCMDDAARRVRVNNIGSSGQDGVEIKWPRGARGPSGDLHLGDVLNGTGSVRAAMRGMTGGVETEMTALSLHGMGDGRAHVVPDFSGVGSPECIATALDADGRVLGQVLLPAGGGVDIGVDQVICGPNSILVWGWITMYNYQCQCYQTYWGVTGCIQLGSFGGNPDMNPARVVFGPANPTIPGEPTATEVTASDVSSMEVRNIQTDNRPCPVDFNGDGFVDFFDYDDYVACFETGACPAGKTADFNGDGFADFFDYDAFVAAFEAGC